jgi:hypothetical protein
MQHSHLTVGARLGMPESIVQAPSVFDQARAILFSHHLAAHAHHRISVPDDGRFFALRSVADRGSVLVHKG